jgi:hypothetical protein
MNEETQRGRESSLIARRDEMLTSPFVAARVLPRGNESIRTF